MYKQNSEFMSIQKKLVGAIAMVLVACIMVVSSSYAWFTLSTAPEVTGIQTSVGSNGNLEMALRSDEYALTEIPTGSQVSMPTANNYWGNLVNLSDASYGLGKIVLKPSRLAWTNSNGNKLSTSYLTVPTYGVDGRISGWASVMSGKLNTNDQFQVGDYVGVRGLGTVSGLTAGQIALRDAVTEVTNTRDSVSGLAKNSLEEDAINLATIIVANQMTGKDSFTAEDMGKIEAAVARLETIATQLKGAMNSVVSAVAVAQGVDIRDKEITYNANGATVADVNNLTIPDDLQAALGKASDTLDSINTKISGAKSDLTTAKQNGAPYTFAQISGAMTKILSVSDIRIADQQLTGKKDEMIKMVMDAYSANDQKLPLNIVDGIYKEIADFVGTYSAQKSVAFDLDGTSYAALSGMPIPIMMKVETAPPTIKDGVNQYYLSYFVTQLNLLEAHDANATKEQIISDLYAFAVDMAFRTNAATSNLMLQTTAASRVGDDTTASVQGGGSYMQFTKGTDEGYTLEQMRGLMSAVRVVLYNTQTNEILGVAALNMAEATADENDANTLKAPLYLYNFTMNDDQSLNLGERRTAENGKTAIVALQQNTELALTALVYLDGDVVGNDDVAISGNSMTGTLNLQFSSSANLNPMDYTFTEDQAATQAPTEASTPATTAP